MQGNGWRAAVRHKVFYPNRLTEFRGRTLDAPLSIPTEQAMDGVFFFFLALICLGGFFATFYLFLRLFFPLRKQALCVGLQPGVGTGCDLGLSSFRDGLVYDYDARVSLATYVLDGRML